MQEIFIPEYIGEKNINNITEGFKEIIENFSYETFDFTSELLSGTVLSFSGEIDEDLIKICNGEFGEYYFIERLPSSKNIFSSGSTLLGDNKIYNEITRITPNITKIISELKSPKLLTRTKMNQLNKEVKSICFTLSALIYTLEGLKRKTEENKHQMDNYSGSIDLESQAHYLSHISIMKQEELKKLLETIYPQIKIFLELIQKIA